MSKITHEQMRYVIEHINDRPRTKVAEGAGISLSAVYRIARKHGGDMLYERARRSPRVVVIYKKWYQIGYHTLAVNNDPYRFDNEGAAEYMAKCLEEAGV